MGHGALNTEIFFVGCGYAQSGIGLLHLVNYAYCTAMRKRKVQRVQVLKPTSATLSASPKFIYGDCNA